MNLGEYIKCLQALEKKYGSNIEVCYVRSDFDCGLQANKVRKPGFIKRDKAFGPDRDCISIGDR